RPGGARREGPAPYEGAYGGASEVASPAPSLEQVAFGNDDHVAFAQRDHRLDGTSALDRVVVEEVEPLLAGRGVGAAELDALGRREAVEPAAEGDRLQQRRAGLHLHLAGVVHL